MFHWLIPKGDLAPVCGLPSLFSIQRRQIASRKDATAHDPTRGFMALPPELRDMVYGHLTGSTNYLRYISKTFWIDFVEDRPYSEVWLCKRPFCPEFANDVQRLHLKNFCSADDWAFKRPQPGWDIIQEIPRVDLPYLRLIFPELKSIRCTYHALEIDWSQVTGYFEHLDRNKGHPVKKAEDFVFTNWRNCASKRVKKPDTASIIARALGTSQ
jgi:hypothetical protein